MTKKGLEKKIYSYNEALEDSTEYFKGDALAASVWINKYALKNSSSSDKINENSNVEIYESNPDQMHKRLAKEFARIESKYENGMSEKKIYNLLKDFKYIIPQGSPMSGIGNEYQKVSISNCFVIGDQSDSYGGICKTDQEQVQLMKRRGGVGHDLGHIRPKKTKVENSALTSTGVVPFMKRYSNSTNEVAQDGRRGALMLSIPIKHPDAEDFIDAKMTPGKITGANVSVKIDDEFMNAVQNGNKYVQQFPLDSRDPSHKVEIDAKKLWDKIVHNAWSSAEPGILFWDQIQRESIPDNYKEEGFETTSTNPCGEIPLCPYDSCRLLAINLYNYVEKPFTSKAKFNFPKFKDHVYSAQRFMDDIVDLETEKIDGILEKIESDPEPEEVKMVEKNLWTKIKEKNLQGRRTGLGITAEGDMLAALGYTYGSNEAIEFSENLHKNLALSAYKSSVDMAKERGAFLIHDTSKEKGSPFLERLREADPELIEDMEKYGRRNISLLTIAPTGTTSMMTQTSSGLENAFLLYYERRTKVNPNDENMRIDETDAEGVPWQKNVVFHHKFRDWLNAAGYNVGEVEEMIKDSSKDEETKNKLEEIVRKSPYNGATSTDVDWVQKVKMQGAVQKYVDHSISVTVNLPEDTPKEVVADVYMEAWKAKCKGITIYREGSRDGVLNSIGSGNDKEEKGFPDKRPKSLDAKVLRFKNENSEGEFEDWISFVGMYNEKPYEIFTGKVDEEVLAVPTSINKGKIVKETNGKSHYDFHFKTKRKYTSVVGGISDQFNIEYWNSARFVSAMLRNEVPLEEVVYTVEKLENSVEGIHSWKQGVVRTLKGFIKDGTKSKSTCPDCGVIYTYQEGCKTCDCGGKCD